MSEAPPIGSSRRAILVPTFESMRFRRRLNSRASTILVVLVSCPFLTSAQGQYRIVGITDISPNQSTLQKEDSDGASGGRVNGLALARDNKIVYAASEWGGLFKSTDGGLQWEHLDNHLPSATWRVAVDPRNSDQVYATSFYDGRVVSNSGINVSSDGGKTWDHPKSSYPPSNFCKSFTSRAEFSAFGISINPENSDSVYVGTACGIAITDNGGKTWAFVDPAPQDPADTVWDVLVQKNGIVDACGDDGHVRSTNGGRTWVRTNSLPSGVCSLAASPYEPDVLFAVVGTQPYESDDGGKSWTKLSNPNAQGRIPFVTTNKRSGNAFDLWFGDVTLYRIGCAESTPRCPAAATAWAGPYTRDVGGHDDTAAIVFADSATADSCPVLFASDGGVYLNTRTQNPDCQEPKWDQPQVTPHGLWLFTMDVAPSQDSKQFNLYLGNQDDGTFGSENALALRPSWFNSDCCDSFVSSASTTHILYASCCYPNGHQNRLFFRGSDLKGGDEINTYPPGELPGWEAHLVAQFGTNKYAVVTTKGVFYTTNLSAKPIRWTSLGQATTPDSICALYVSLPKPNSPVFFGQTLNCNGRGPSKLYRIDGTSPGAKWSLINLPSPDGGFGVFAVDPHDPLRMFASFLQDPGTSVSMISTADGGGHWVNNSVLDTMMTQNGALKYRTAIGPTDFTSFNGYPQPSLIAFDPNDPKIIVAAGIDSGVFVSFDQGNLWQVVLPKGRTLSRVRAATFASVTSTDEVIFLGSQGSGIWRLDIAK